MDTERLIQGLAKDARLSAPRLPAVLAWALAAAAITACLVFFILLGPRADVAQAAETPRFLFKFVVTLSLAFTAAAAVFAASRPGASVRSAALLLAAAPLLLAGSLLVEISVVPQADWATLWIGTNMANCLTFIPLIGILPLAILLYAMRQGAPTRPAFAGALAGLLAGGIAATFYGMHCDDDSPFFVATWYPIAIAGLALVGAVAGSRVLRW